MKRIIAIASGLLEPKKQYTEINKRNLYLNYGLLSVCTALKHAGYDVKQFQGEYYTPTELIEQIEKSDYCLKEINTPILLSIVSFISIEWCRVLTHLLKHEYGKKIIMGGKYVIDGNLEWLKMQLPDVDIFVPGDGESIIKDIIEDNTLAFPHNKDIGISYSKSTCLDYSILYEFEKYNPSIELSRGCGRGCRFCADAKRSLTKTKDAELVVFEIQELERLYKHEQFTIYYQFPSLYLSEEWISSYFQSSMNLDYLHQWRCTSRVDLLDHTLLQKMSEIGLKVIDLGFETASKSQLVAIGKTKHPSEYLYHADKILEEASKHNVWIKLNILLSPGDTRGTINETIMWLQRRKEYIKGVSVNSETIYGPNNHIMDIYKKYGATYLDPSDLIRKGYANINLSSDISHDLAKRISLEISQMMMTAKDYFDLKKYGYFSRFYTYTNFCADISVLNRNELPFSI